MLSWFMERERVSFLCLGGFLCCLVLVGIYFVGVGCGC